MSQENKAKKIKSNKPEQSNGQVPSPDPKKLIDVSLGIIQSEIGKLKAVSSESQLDSSQARILTDYVKTLVVVDKNNKDNPADSDVDEMSEEELLALATEAIKVVKKDK